MDQEASASWSLHFMDPLLKFAGLDDIARDASRSFALSLSAADMQRAGFGSQHSRRVRRPARGTGVRRRARGPWHRRS